MPKKIDHKNARVTLARLAPETLQAITVRLPAGLLVTVHQWAEHKGLDLASAIRELVTLGQEASCAPWRAPIGDGPQYHQEMDKARRPRLTRGSVAF